MLRKRQRSFMQRFMCLSLALLLIFTSSVWLSGNASAATSWSTLTSNTTNPIYKVAYGNGMWVGATDGGGKIVTSSNGSSWTERTVDAGYTDSFLNVTYASGKWVLTGNSGRVYTSSDALTWTNYSTGNTAFNISGVAYGNSTYVLAANSGNLYYSSDATTWTNVKPDTINFLGVAYGNGLFVAVGDNGVTYTSPNGVTWTSRGPIASGNSLYSVRYLNGTFYATSDGLIATSTNGTTWSTQSISASSGSPLYDISYSGGKYVIVGGAVSSSGIVLVSSNGTSWTLESPNTDQDLYGIATNDNLFVAGGGSGVLRSQSIAPSTDATLSNLAINQGTLNPTFASGTTAYTANVAYGVTSINVTPTVNQANATVTVNGTTTTSGSAQAVSLSVGSNSIPVVVTAQDGTTTQTYTINVTRAAPSTDATLSNLAINQGVLTPTFASGTTSYSATVAYTVNSINVTPTVNQANATVKVNGTTTTSGSAHAVALSVGSNSIPVVVTAQDGSTSQTYTITVTRAAASTNANLSGLSLSSGTLTPTFDAGTTSYSASVANTTTSITVTPTTSSTNATVTVNGTTVTSGSASSSIGLAVGSNTISVVVTAQDGSTTKTYTLTVTRAAATSTDATLSNLAVNQGTLSPTFAPGTTSYSVSVPNNATSINVTPTVNQANATVTVNGATTTSGSAQTIPLAVGSNTIQVVVTAQDGSTTKTYTITVTRAAAASTDATLGSLAVNQGTLSPSFASGTTSYSVSVVNSVSSINVTPTVNQANATVTVNGTTTTSGSAQTIPLAVGANTIQVVVTAQDGSTTKTYTITVTRAAAASTDATLGSLAVNQGTLSPSFASGTTSYSVSVANSVSSINVTPTVNQANATVTVNGATTTSGSAQTIPLAVGANTIQVVVTAQDGSTTKTYTITVIRAASTNATLSALTISAGTLSPTFSSSITNYSSNVSNATTSTTITPTSTENTATITVNGTTTTSGSSTTSIPLAVGANTIQVTVTAEDGNTTKTYTITIVRQGSSNNDLNNLTISAGTLSPVFAPGTTSYTTSVPNATTSVTVTPTLADNTANVTVNGSYVSSGSASGTIALSTGSNTISIVVTAQNNMTQTYTIQVTRLQNPNLSNLTISAGTLTPAFDADQLSYTATVEYASSSIQVTPTTVGTPQTLTVDGISATSGSPTTVSLSVGSNSVPVVIAMSDGATRTYTLAITRNDISDSDAVQQTYDALEIGYAQGDSSNSVTQNLDLPLNGDHATTISWVSSNPDVIQNDGTVTRPSYPSSDATVTLNALIQKGSSLKIKTFTVLVKALAITDEQAVIEDRDALQLGFAPGDDKTSVTQNIALPITGSNGTTISWTSDASATIDENGKVTRPSYVEGDRTVKLTATIVRGSVSEIREFAVVVKASPASPVADLQALAINGFTLTPAFDRGTREYALNVPNATSSVSVTASVYTEGSTFTVQGVSVANGESSAPIELTVGTNTIAVKVTAQDGITQDVYTIRVERAAASNPGGNNGGATEPVTTSPVVTTPTTPTTPPASSSSGFEIRVNGRLVEQIATGALTQVNGQAVFNAVIDTGKLTSLLAGEGANPLVVVPVTATADKVSTQLSGEAVQLLQDRGATLRVETTLGSYTLPASELRLAQLGGAPGSNAASDQLKVDITVQRSEANVISALNTRASVSGFTVVQPPVDFDITATYGDQTAALNSFSNYVERELPVPSGYDPNRITTAVVIEADGSIRHVPTAVTRSNDTYFAEINSLTNSDYALIWSPKQFTDVAGLWSQTAVNDMGSRQIVNGIDDSRFNPSGSVTRAEFAAILVRALGLPDNGTASTFRDVPSGEWYAGAVSKAAEYGLIDGYADGTFRPTNTISRQEAFAVLARAAQVAKPVSTTDGTSLEAYSDADKVGKWATENLRFVLSSGLVQGSGGKLNPNATLSRAETAAIVQRLLKKAELID
ncbi:cadherin-like beta sandwich domain-containing protein [Saccharibacillus sacchari]|uniref:Cadherin-like beta sandwich domain-containing protein n=1 Tax=Saccharibacillus sacchari TaxID=456493 RepID=A0ACC6PAR2_9BACL